MKRKSRSPQSSEPPPARDPRRARFLAPVALVLLTLLAFSNSFSTGFALDNQMLILRDTRIQTASASDIALIVGQTYWWPNGESGLYRPLTTFSYLLNYAILDNANRPAGYHWINFFLHAANVLLVFTLLTRLTASRTAFFIAALWAVHPVLTESVTNIVGRADLLAAFAVLSGFFLYLKSTETTGWLAGLAIVSAVGAFSKESAVMLPVVIILYEVVCARRWRKMLFGCLAALVPIALMLWQRAIVLSSSLPAEYPFTDNPIAGAGFWIGRLTAIKVLARYLWLAFWPIKLSSDYSYSQIPLARGTPEDWVCWLAVAVAVVLAAILWRRNRLAFFFVVFAFLNLLPASNLLFPIGTIMAERLLYLPVLGLMAAVVLLADRSRGFPIIVAVVIIAFAVRTWMRNIDWTNDETMAAATVQTSPGSFKPHELLAAALFDRDLDRAVAEADRSIAILAPLPDVLSSAGAWNFAAMCHRAKGQYQETARLALRSIAIDASSRAEYNRRHGINPPAPPSAADGYRTLASAYLHLNRPPEALGAALEAQTIDPANSGVYVEIADAYFAQGRGEDAAIALAEGMLASGDSHLLDELLKLYRSGVDAKGCAMKTGPHGPTLNPACEIVVRDLCAAALRAHRPEVRSRLGCPNL